jgi:hypothetical protein
MQDSDLEGFFAAARAEAPMPSPALMARIEADALRQQALRARRQPTRTTRRYGPVARLFEALGGAGVAAGLAAATLAGLWIGLAQPAPLSRLTEPLAGGSAAAMLDSVELIPSLDPFAAEG